MPFSEISLYLLFSYHIHLPKCVSVAMATGFVSSACGLSDFLWGLIEFPEAAELPTQQLSLFVGTSAHSPCHFQWMFTPCVGGGNNAMTSVQRKAFWQLPLRIQKEAVVWEAVWHCVRGPTCTIWCAHLCGGRLWGSDDVTDTDALQCGPMKSTQGQM